MAQSVRTTRMLRTLLPPWAHERIGSAPAQPSYVADDGFPAEMSVNWSGRHPELRVLFDSLGHDVGLPAESGSRRLQGVQEVFTPRAGRPSPAPLWHSIAWRPPSTVVHKTYFGLYPWPHAQREAAVAEAMARLGMAAAWDETRRRVETVEGAREIEFFAVDVADEAEARVKVYYRNHGAGLAEVDRVASVALRHDADDARAAYRILAGDREDAGEAALSCLAFRSGADRAAESTTYLRLPDLASGDEEAVERTAALLHREGVDPGRFRLLTAALAPEPLSTTNILELVSYRTAGRRGDVTTYFRFPVYDRSLTPVDLD
ncbi:hypothetical protein [Amycolatopsis sp. NBRC 101858]|uniref:hypothetical protein n=1 Tax=Amycolatopsis sp. NBRC 101858 TaxID=3032200 RepID=UPI002552C9AE|nr:hypothetical protein [Amycolatopsis sp. NBRC 101858]